MDQMVATKVTPLLCKAGRLTNVDGFAMSCD